MKIDGQNLADDLLQRMQEAHEKQQVDRTGGADATGQTQKSFSVADARRSEPAAPVQKVDGELEVRLKATAEKALRGEFDSAADVRGAVIEDIISERFADGLKGSRRRKMIRTLQTALVEDPEFIRQVDDMLILAARDLGRNR